MTNINHIIGKIEKVDLKDENTIEASKINYLNNTMN